MRLDDLDVVVVAQDLRRALGELVGGVHTDGEVGRHHDGRLFRCFANRLLLRSGEPRRTDHRGLGVLEIRERAVGPCEVDEHVAACGGGSIGTDLEVADPGADGWIAGEIESRAELAVLVGKHGLDERAPHPAASAGEGDAHRAAHRPAAGEATSPWMRSSLLSTKKSAMRRSSRLPRWSSRQ